MDTNNLLTLCLLALQYQKTIKGLNEKLASDDAAYQASVSGYENEISRKVMNPARNFDDCGLKICVTCYSKENEIEDMKRRLLLLQDKSSLDNVKMVCKHFSIMFNLSGGQPESSIYPVVSLSLCRSVYQYFL